MSLKIILTGSTGMVGEAVLLCCLQNPKVESILVINRRPCGYKHSKLKEIIHSDFFDLKKIEDELKPYNACLFCLGVSSIGLKETDYFKLTHTLTLNFAETLVKLNPEMCFSYISGLGTDSSEKGKIMWARVKGKTENDIFKLPFKNAFAFRPGMLKPKANQKNIQSYYKYFAWLYPLLRWVLPRYACSLDELGAAMIYVSEFGYTKNHIEVIDIVQIAKKYNENI